LGRESDLCLISLTPSAPRNKVFGSFLARSCTKSRVSRGK
jgi:hypothetical protein